MHKFLHKLFIIIGLSLGLTSVSAQYVDTVFQHIYTVGQDATIDLSFEHSEINIKTNNTDSVNITTRVKLIPANYQTPFADITEEASQKDALNIFSSLMVGESIQPQNELKVISYISIPNGSNIKIKTRYCQVYLQSESGQINAELDYSSFSSGPMPADTNHIFKANYSEISFTTLNNSLKIDGLNINLKAEHISNLEANTQFSEYEIKKINNLKCKSYTDKFRLGSLDSMYLKSEYSSCIIDKAKQFLQAEMSYGTLQVNTIPTDFKAINIANSYVNTKLIFSNENNFIINADMRYCKLIQDKIELTETISPTGNLHKGIYGKLTLSEANVSIISSFGDVKIDFK